MSATLDVIGVGDVDLDIFIRVPHRPGPDEKVVATEVHRCPGGMVGNVVVALSAFGTTCGVIAVVGNDADGQDVRTNLQAWGVRLDGLHTHPNAPTFMCIVLIASDAEKSLILTPTDAFWPTTTDVTAELLSTARHVHTTTDRPEVAYATLTMAHSLGLSTSLDLEVGKFASSTVGWDDLVSQTDVLFTNGRSAQVVTGMGDTKEAAAALQTRGPRSVAVTCGAAGAVLCDQHGTLVAPAQPAMVVDTTGAGDRFAAALLHAWLRGWPVTDQLHFALEHAAHAVTGVGSQAGLPQENRRL